MSIGLAEEKKLKTKTMDQKEEKASSSREVTTTASSPIPTLTSLPLQSEIFDSSSDNAMAEMKEVADMGPDETTRVFSQMEEIQQWILDNKYQ